MNWLIGHSGNNIFKNILQDSEYSFSIFYDNYTYKSYSISNEIHERIQEKLLYFRFEL